MLPELKAKISLDGSGFQRGIKDVKRATDGVDKQFSSLKSKVAEMFGAGLVLGAARALIRATVNHALEVDELSRKYGITTSEVQSLMRAGKELGITFDEAFKKIDPAALRSAITDFSENEIRSMKNVADEWGAFSKDFVKKSATGISASVDTFYWWKGIGKGLMTSNWDEAMQRWYSAYNPGLKNPPQPAAPFGMGPEFVKPGSSMDLLNSLGNVQSGTEGTGEGAPMRKESSKAVSIGRVNALQAIGAQIATAGPEQQIAMVMPKLVAALDRNSKSQEGVKQAMANLRKDLPGSAALFDAMFR